MARLTELSPAERYDELADAMTKTVDGVTDWDAPTPVREWCARDVIAHLTAWLPAVLTAGSTIKFLPIADAKVDPVEAWDGLNAQVSGIINDTDLAEREFSSAQMNATTVGAVIDQYFTPDIFMHRWDLARSNGLDDTLDASLVHDSYAGMRQIEEMLRQSGQFGTQQEVPDDASEQDRFIAFIGRDPRWTQPG